MSFNDQFKPVYRPGVVDLSQTRRHILSPHPKLVEFHEQFGDPLPIEARFTLLQQDQPVAHAGFSQPIQYYKPGRFRIVLDVHPRFQRRGLGSILYDELMQVLKAYHPSDLRVQITMPIDQDPSEHAGYRFAVRKGFMEHRRFGIFHFHFNKKDYYPLQHAASDAVQRIAPIEVINLAAYQERTPDTFSDQLYALYCELLQDNDGMEQPFKVSAAHFYEFHTKKALHQPEGYWLAVDGDRLVGKHVLELRETGSVLASQTGVLRSHRGKGIARALKYQGMFWSALQKSNKLVSDIALDNTIMIDWQARLGFRLVEYRYAFIQKLDPTI